MIAITNSSIIGGIVAAAIGMIGIVTLIAFAQWQHFKVVASPKNDEADNNNDNTNRNTSTTDDASSITHGGKPWKSILLTGFLTVILSVAVQFLIQRFFLRAPISITSRFRLFPTSGGEWALSITLLVFQVLIMTGLCGFFPCCCCLNTKNHSMKLAPLFACFLFVHAWGLCIMYHEEVKSGIGFTTSGKDFSKVVGWELHDSSSIDGDDVFAVIHLEYNDRLGWIGLNNNGSDICFGSILTNCTWFEADTLEPGFPPTEGNSNQGWFEDSLDHQSFNSDAMKHFCSKGPTTNATDDENAEEIIAYNVFWNTYTCTATWSTADLVWGQERRDKQFRALSAAILRDPFGYVSIVLAMVALTVLCSANARESPEVGVTTPTEPYSDDA